MVPAGLLRIALSLTLAVAGALAVERPAAAQGIAVVVNGAPITEFDISSRARLLALSNRGRAPARTQVVDDLIDERLKLQEARRLRITITEAEIDGAFRQIAERARMQPPQLATALQRSGVPVRTLRDRLRGDMAWQRVVQARAQQRINIRDQDVIDAMRRRGQDPATVRAFEYQLAQVVVFGTGADRRRVAEALRASINGCETLRQRLQGQRDAAARDPIRRISTELPQQLRDIIDRTAIGRSTPLNQSQQGFEFAVVCSRREVPGREAATQQVRQELIGQEMQNVSTNLLRELRERATIDRRRG